MSDTKGFIEEFINTLEIQGDESFSDLLDFILAKARRLTMAEAGTVFICEPLLTDQSNTLRCQVAQNDEVKIEQESFTLPIDPYSIAGYTASHCETLKIDDLYNMESGKPFEFNPAFDKRYGYKSVSMLSVPIKNVKNEAIGVIQLLNHLPEAGSEERCVPFRDEDKKNMEGLSFIIGMMIEHAALMEEVQRLKNRY